MNNNFFMKIAIDLDGVTIDSISSWLRKFHPTFTKDQIYTFDLWKIPNLCTKDQFFREFEQLDPDDTSLIEGAKETILQLSNEFEVFFLTRKTQRQLIWTKAVLEREGLDHIPLTAIWNEKKNTINYDILIDDSPTVLKESIKPSIVFNQPWNKDVKDIPRAMNWKDVYSFIKTVDSYKHILSKV